MHSFVGLCLCVFIVLFFSYLMEGRRDGNPLVMAVRHTFGFAAITVIWMGPVLIIYTLCCLFGGR